jgi:predicted secreted protein
MSLPVIKGKESLFYIKKNDVWFPVGCLTSSPLSEDMEMIGTTTRDNNGWKTGFPTNQSYTIALNGLMVMDDDDSNNNILSYRELRRMKRNKELIEWKRKTLEGYYVDQGSAFITSISDSDEADGFITFQATLQGFGAPVESNERVYVLGDGERTQIYTHADDITVIQTKEI